MSTCTVTTQAELDSALADPAVDRVIIDSPRGVWLCVTSNGANSATVEAWGSATVEAWGSATVRASDSATVGAWGSATVEASDSATVGAWDSATVEAWGSATVRAWDSATVRATPWVAVHLHGARATVTGGHIIDVSALDLTDAPTWCAYHGVPVVDGVATLYKAIGDTWTTDRGTDYSPGSAPEAADWRDDHQCGGGLHFSPTPTQARDYHPSATRYVAVGVRLDELSPILGGTPKAKARRVVVACREVTIDGTEVAS